MTSLSDFRSTVRTFNDLDSGRHSGELSGLSGLSELSELSLGVFLGV